MSTEMVAQKRKRGRPPVANDTRERILEAAIEHFSRRSYEETGLREIASAAQVDVAYVHRCFGSKKRLFADAVSAAVRPKELLEELPRQDSGDLGVGCAGDTRDARQRTGHHPELDRQPRRGSNRARLLCL